MPIQEGRPLTDELLQAALQAAKAFDGRLEFRVDAAFSREVFLKLPEHIRARMRPPAADHGVPVTIYDPASLPQRIRVQASDQIPC